MTYKMSGNARERCRTGTKAKAQSCANPGMWRRDRTNVRTARNERKARACRSGPRKLQVTAVRRVASSAFALVRQLRESLLRHWLRAAPFPPRLPLSAHAHAPPPPPNNDNNDQDGYYRRLLAVAEHKSKLVFGPVRAARSGAVPSREPCFMD